MKIFLFSDLSLSTGSEAAWVVCLRDKVLDRSMLTMYEDTNKLPQNQNIAPIVGWEAAVSMMHQCAVFLLATIGTETDHRSVYEILLLIDMSEELSSHLQDQACHRPYTQADLVRLIRNEFNKI